MVTEWSVLVMSIVLVSALHLSCALFLTYPQNSHYNSCFKAKSFSVFFALVAIYSVLGLLLYTEIETNAYTFGAYFVLSVGVLINTEINRMIKAFVVILTLLLLLCLAYLGDHRIFLNTSSIVFDVISVAICVTVISAASVYLIKSKMESWLVLVLIGFLAYYLISIVIVAGKFMPVAELKNSYLLASVIAMSQIVVLIKLHFNKANELKQHRLAAELVQVGIIVLDRANTLVYSNNYFRQCFSPAKQKALINQCTNEVAIINTKINQGDRWSSVIQTGFGKDKDYTSVTSCVLFDEKKAATTLRVLTLIDVTEQTNYKKALEDSSNKLNELSNRILSSHEIERAKISRELHQDIGQQLTLLKFTSAFIERADIRQQLELGVEGILQSVRGMSRQLRPAVMDELGLQKALEGFIKSAALHDVAVSYRFNNLGFDISHPIDINLYRIIYEYITTVVVEGKATEIALEVQGDNEKLVLTIEDNGTDFDSHALVTENKGITPEGLLTVKERVRVLGGKITVSSKTTERSWSRIEIDADS